MNRQLTVIEYAFWRSMDTQRHNNQLEDMWQGGKAPWKVW